MVLTREVEGQGRSRLGGGGLCRSLKKIEIRFETSVLARHRPGVVRRGPVFGARSGLR